MATPSWRTAPIGALLGTVLLAAPMAAAQYTFTETTNTAGVANAGLVDHFGATWSDYDGDGLLDLYVVNACVCSLPDPAGANTLYHNNGDGTFTDVTVATGTGDIHEAMRNVWADYDRDGDLDFYSNNFVQSTLYRNNNNVFTDVNAQSGAGVAMLKGTGAGWADYDNDGHLDMHLTAFPGENALFHNNGDGTFTEVRASAGFPLAAAGMGNAWADFNNDGFQDLAIAAVPGGGHNDFSFLYRNNGDGTFTDISTSAGIVLEAGASTAAVSWGDYDNDGFLDLVVTEVALGSSKVLPNRIYLYRNNGDETFTDVTAATQLALSAGSTEYWEASWADWDNDGDVDLFIGALGANMFFRNNGDGTFTDIAPTLGLDDVRRANGAIWGDHDEDGDIDLYIVRKFASNSLMDNDGGTNRWLQVELRGTVSNPDAIGARILVSAGGNNQLLEINGGTGFFSQHSPIQQFGLGSNATADVHVTWPSGQTDTLNGVTANQRLQIVEGQPAGASISVTPTSVDYGPVTNGGFRDLIVSIANLGAADLTINTVAITSGEFVAEVLPLPLTIVSGGASVPLSVRFNPTSLGVQNGNLEITSADPGQPVFSVPLTGEGVTAPAAVTYRINAGGADYTDVDGDLFVADKAYVAGDFGYASGNPATFGGAVVGTTDDLLYQDMRSDGTQLRYNFDNLPPGDYEITLHFIDPNSPGPGAKVMDVGAEGNVDLAGLDVFAAAGGVMTALTRTFTTTVIDGQLSLNFAPIAGPNGWVCAIEVTGVAQPPGPVPNGLFGTAMTAMRTDGTGAEVQLDWDVSTCSETGYELLYGSLSSVGTYALDGGECGLGTSGTHAWASVPAGDLWFLLVSEDGAGIEGSWGKDSGDTERAGTSASGECGNLLRDNVASCAAPPPPSGPYSFQDVTAAAGVADELHGHFGMAWFDYNGDGWYDLYSVNGKAPAFSFESLNVLYENNGDGTFTDVTAATQTADPWVAMRNVAADYDRDGDQDFYSHNFEQSTLYRNDNGVYTDVNSTSGASLTLLRGTGAAWADYDNDGWPDIHATAFPGENALLRNNGDGTFTNVQAASGLPLFASAMGNAWGDYDNDGDQDLAVAAVTPDTPEILFRNNGDGTFTDVSAAAGLILEPGGSTAPVTWGDYDNDGWLDLFISEVTLGSAKVIPTRMYLFHNNQDGTFSDVTAAAGIVGPPGPGDVEFWDAGFADYDYDGDHDLFVTADGPNMVFQNNGDGTFTDIAAQLGLDDPLSYASVGFADFDDDKDLDFYLARHDHGTQTIPQPNKLFVNAGGTNNWLYINLTGVASNIDAIGARVTVTIGANQQIYETRAGRGFFTQDSKTIELGLGQATLVDTLTVRWPSGAVTTLNSVAANQVLDIVEP